MAEQRTYNGYVYQRSAPGEAWQLVGPAQPIVIGRPDPALPSQMRKTTAQAATEEAQAPYAGPIAAATAQKAAADALAAQAAAARAQKEQAAAPNPENAKIARALQTDSVLEAINTARAQIGKGWATGNIAGTRAFQSLPVVGQNSTNLNATLSGLQGSIINDTLAALKASSANGASGYGSLTESEAQRLAAAVGALQQSQDSQSLETNLARVERHYRNALALLNNEDPRDEAVQVKYGILNPDDKPAGNAGPSGKITSEGRYENKAALAGVNARVESLIREGRDESAIRSYLNTVQPGLGDSAVNIGDAVRFHQQFPNDPMDINLEQQWQPNSAVGQALGDIGQTPYGAGAIGAGDFMSGGLLDNLSANPELARATMAGVQEQQPLPYFLGQLAGGVGSGLAVEGALARGGLTGLARMRAGDAALGGIYGAGSTDEGSRIGGATLGAASGIGGGMLGRGVSRAAGTALGGVRDAARTYLNEAGVPMTIGQMLGGAIQRTEDRISGLPFVGDQIRNRRMEGFEGLNRAAFDQGLAPIGGSTGGVIAEPGIDIARQLRGDAYSAALDPVTVQADAPFVQDMTATIQAGRRLPSPMREGLDYTLPTRVGQSFDNQGILSGRDFQQSIRGLRRDAGAVANQPYGYDFGQITGQAEAALEGLLQRQSPETLPLYRAANEANRNVEVLREAVNAARNGSRSGTPGIFSASQLSDAASRNAKKFGNSQGTTMQPFYELSRAGQEVLPSTVPDSGTTGRAILPAVALGLLGGGGAAVAEEGGAAQKAGSGLGTGAIVAALAATPYSAGARNVIQRALMAERPEVMRQAGDILVNQQRIASLLAAPLAIEYTGQ